jgi:hypothetical protein
MNAPLIDVPAANPLSPDHFRLIEEAQKRTRKIRNASKFAVFNAWSLAIFAVFGGCAALFGDFTSLITGIALGIFAFNEFRGAKFLKLFDMRGPKLLGWNQVGLGIALVVYAIWSLFASRGSDLSSMSSGDPHIDETMQSLTSVVSLGLYGSLAVIGVVVPGLTAIYYFTRAGTMKTLLASTEPWIIQTIRAAA